MSRTAPSFRTFSKYLAAFSAGVLATVLVGAADPYAGLDLFARVLTDIDTKYERPIPLENVVHAALGGVAKVLDEHSEFYPPDAWAAIGRREDTAPLGIGATLVSDTCGLRIERLEPWGPAEDNGLLPGDCILAMDGLPLPSPALTTALDAPPHTVARLRVRRGDTEREVVIMRARPKEPALRVEDLPRGTVYARVAHFGDRVAAPLAAAVATRGGVRGMVLDLRANPGGQVEEAAALCDLFVSRGTLVTTRTRVAGETVLVATPSRADWTFPLAILVDEETASAAEIVAGALHDLGRATLVGTRTYGKGTVQRLFQYEDGSALKLTVGRYFLPLGQPIQDHQGIEPEVRVTRPLGADGHPSLLDFHTPASKRTDPELSAALLALGTPPR